MHRISSENEVKGTWNLKEEEKLGEGGLTRRGNWRPRKYNPIHLPPGLSLGFSGWPSRAKLLFLICGNPLDNTVHSFRHLTHLLCN
jgi:hypothetical protein